MLALRLVENVLLYFGSEATQREQFGWNGCGTRYPDHTECKLSVDIRWVVFRAEPGAIHSRESARNIPAFFRGETAKNGKPGSAARPVTCRSG
jgi:hypothetical protein